LETNHSWTTGWAHARDSGTAKDIPLFYLIFVKDSPVKTLLDSGRRAAAKFLSLVSRTHCGLDVCESQVI
jgi:hypothetical protein